MSGRLTLDTNVLFYASDSTVLVKRDRAQSLIRAAAQRDAILTLQSLGELFNSLTKRRIFSSAAAGQIVLAYRETFKVIAAAESDLPAAIEAQQHHNLSFWNAMLWATARRSGCNLILTEDLQDGRTLGGVTFRNPFKLPAEELSALLD